MATKELPEDLTVEILQQLPVKSLLRFKGLSKSLCAIIDNPYFIINSYSQNFNLQKLIFNDTKTNECHVYDVNLEESHLRLKKQVSYKHMLFVGPYCNGLLLFYRTYEFEIGVWNPSTRHCQSMNYADWPFRLRNIMGSGLGYDDSIDDYKVCFIVSCPSSDTKVWIYELKSNIWRMAHKDFPNYVESRRLGCSGTGFFTDINGSINWLWKSEIIEFDVRKETFSILPQPEINSSLNGEKVETKLHVLRGCLCISYFFNRWADQADLYMRKKVDGDDQFTWTKLYSVTESFLLLGYVKVLGYSKKRDKILLHVHLDGMVWYDIKKKKFRKSRKDIPNGEIDVIPIVGSLVSIRDEAF